MGGQPGQGFTTTRLVLNQSVPEAEEHVTIWGGGGGENEMAMGSSGLCIILGIARSYVRIKYLHL